MYTKHPLLLLRGSQLLDFPLLLVQILLSVVLRDLVQVDVVTGRNIVRASRAEEPALKRQ